MVLCCGCFLDIDLHLFFVNLLTVTQALHITAKIFCVRVNSWFDYLFKCKSILMNVPLLRIYFSRTERCDMISIFMVHYYLLKVARGATIKLLITPYSFMGRLISFK